MRENLGSTSELNQLSQNHNLESEVFLKYQESLAFVVSVNEDEHNLNTISK